MAVIMVGREMNNNNSWFENGMNTWRHVIQVSERTLIDNVAATVPWLAPVSPAYMVWHNAVTLLGWPVWVAWVVALAVEGLGLSVVATSFQLWREKRNTFWMAVCTTVFYLAIVITVNVALDLGAPAWFAKALLSLLSVPAAVTIALRTQNAQATDEEKNMEYLRLENQRKSEELEYERKVAAEEREYMRRVDAEERARRHEIRVEKLAHSDPKVSGNFPKGIQVTESFEKYSDWRQIPQQERERIALMSTKEVMAMFGTSERTATNWRKEALKNVGG